MHRLLYLALLFPAIAHSESPLMTIGELRTLCKSSNPTHRTACDAYIVGVAESQLATLSIVTDILKEEGKTKYVVGSLFCDDRSGTKEQLTAPIRKHINDSKDQPNSPAIWIVFQSLTKSFPCQK